MKKTFSRCPTCGAKLPHNSTECKYCHTTIVDDVEEIVIHKKNKEEELQEKILKQIQREVKFKQKFKLFLWALLGVGFLMLFFALPITLIVFTASEFALKNVGANVLILISIMLSCVMIFGVLFSIVYFKFFIKKVKIFKS